MLCCSPRTTALYRPSTMTTRVMSSKLSRVATQLPGLKTSLLGLAEGVAGREIHGGSAFQSRVMEALVRPISTSVIQAKTGGEVQDTSLQQRESNVPVARGRGRGRGRSDQLAPTRGVFDLWDPISPAATLQQMLSTVERLFDSSILPSSLSQVAPTVPALVRPPWDVAEDKDAYHLRVDMPGLGKDDVKVMVEDGTLVIKGEHKAEEKEGDKWAARTYGSYYLRVILPDDIKFDEVKAELKNGVLEVTVPKSTEHPKKEAIEIPVI
ncbi:unnamed protein product [Sphagnum tenellum]